MLPVKAIGLGETYEDESVFAYLIYGTENLHLI
jgi:hypothetical protein